MIHYDAKTQKGIPYIAVLYSSNFDYNCVVDDLDSMFLTRRDILNGTGQTTSYTIGSRSRSSGVATATEFLSLWNEYMAKKKRIERNARPRKVVGIVMRDW